MPFSVRSLRALRTVLMAACALGCFGCNNAPTLPLPPPVAETSAPNSKGLALVEGEALPAAYVFIVNEDLDLGVITLAGDDGKFGAEIAAEIGDDLTLWQELDGKDGERKHLEVPAP